MSTKKFFEGMGVLFVVAVLLLFGTEAFGQVLPIGQRIQPTYSITVAIDKQPVVILVMNSRLDDGSKMQGMYDYMLEVFTKNCAKGCSEQARERVKEKILKEAAKRKISASHVVFK